MQPLRHVLCIDDEPDILEVARLSLETVGGLRVSCLNDTTQAIEHIRTIAPDLLLVDVMMPHMDGPAILAALRAHPTLAHLPVVFMTARVQPAEMAKYRELGATGVIAKPFDPMELSQEVQRIWETVHDA